MKNYIIAIDQSTSATKAMLFDESCHLLARQDREHKQHYPQAGYVEHDAEEIYRNTVDVIRAVVGTTDVRESNYTLCITNQRETAVVWDKHSGRPIGGAVVWQDTRGAEICRSLREAGHEALVRKRSGLLIDPNFSASGIKWLLDNVGGAREAARRGDLLMGTIDTWLVWKLTEGRVFATDTTNASRTMLFNIHTLDWDDDLLRLFDIPRQMLAEVRPCDALYGETTVEGTFGNPISIAGVLGDSHGALVGQMCFDEGTGKVTYGTGSSVMVNIGTRALPAPQGLVTSIGYTALGKTYYGYEGNIYSTGATLKWMADQMMLIDNPAATEAEATSVADNGGVYVVPAFAGLGAPWWRMNSKAGIVGMTFATSRAHIVRAALESIAYQIKDLTDVMSSGIGGKVSEICADGGPTKNKFLMQFQADLLQSAVVCTEVEDASALGAVVMNGFARGVWKTFDDVRPLRRVRQRIEPKPENEQMKALYEGWRMAVDRVTK